MSNYDKYLKYKAKYLELQEILLEGGVKRKLSKDSLYNYINFINRAIKNHKLPELAKLKLEGGKNKKNYLFVIDMQYDFIDEPYGNKKSGSFAVSDGKNLLKKNSKLLQIIKWSGWDHVYFTRDYHPEKHCSFFTNGGSYPPHCVIGDDGSKLHHKIEIVYKQLKENNKATVLFKGCNKDYDSYGAQIYNQDDYCRRRQKLSNCNNTCDESHTKTGALKLKEKISKDKLDLELDLELGLKVTFDDLEKYNYPEIENSENVNIYVCGLAGDFCVKDTAINFKSTKPKANVYVINELTRYPLLPLHVKVLLSIQANQGEDLRNKQIEEFNKYKKNISNKYANYYIIKKENNKYSILKHTDIEKLEFNELIKYNSDDYKYGNLFSYITDPKELLEDYKRFNVILGTLRKK